PAEHTGRTQDLSPPPAVVAAGSRRRTRRCDTHYLYTDRFETPRLMEAPLAGWRPDVYTRGVRASDRAYLTLREEIIEGALAPGSVLGEVEQSARLGLSRTPLREALGRLVADGLAEQSPRRGIVVLAARRAAENVAHQPASTGHSPRELLADLAVRFETATVDLAAGADPTAYYALTEELDAAIDSAAGNRHLADALRDVRVHLGRL